MHVGTGVGGPQGVRLTACRWRGHTCLHWSAGPRPAATAQPRCECHEDCYGTPCYPELRQHESRRQSSG